MDRSTIHTYRARWILPVASPPIDGGYLTLLDGRVVASGKTTDASQIEDLGDVALLPGLVNTHTHLEFSNLSKPLGTDSKTFADWIRSVLAHRPVERKRETFDKPTSVLHGLDESRRSGTLALGEITTSPFSEKQQIRSPLDGISFLELRGMSDPQVATQIESAQIFLANQAALCQHWSVGLSPHAPYTAHPDLVRHAVELSVQAQCPVAMHLAETREELELLSSQSGPLRELLDERQFWNPTAIASNFRPLDYLEMLVQAPRCLVVHGNYLDRDEVELLANHRDNASLVYCPRTHAYFKHDPYPLATMHRAGVHVALGTDSRASNPDLSMWSELKFAVSKHADVNPSELLKMATYNGTIALGIDHFSPDQHAFGNWLVASFKEDRRNDPFACLTDETSSVAWLCSTANMYQ